MYQPHYVCLAIDCRRRSRRQGHFGHCEQCEEAIRGIIDRMLTPTEAEAIALMQEYAA